MCCAVKSVKALSAVGNQSQRCIQLVAIESSNFLKRPLRHEKFPNWNDTIDIFAIYLGNLLACDGVGD